MADDDDNGNPPSSSQLVKQWFDQLEATLQQEAKLAGLFGHGTLIGSAREFFVAHSVLRTLLPPSVHIGTGLVLGPQGRSKQVDIVLYDPHCPLMEIQPGIGMYLVEGVIATMEIKSQLTPGKLREALDNCNSVSAVGWSVRGPEPLDASASQLISTRGMSLKCAEDTVKWSLTPRNYIFSFTTKMSTKGIFQVANDWYNINGQSRTAYFPCLPAVIVTHGTTGLLNDDWMIVDPGEDLRTRMRIEDGEDARVVMGFWKTSRQFGWLAIRLLHDIHSRFGLPHPATGARLAIDGYLPVNAYVAEDDFHGQLARYITWDRKKYVAAGGTD